MPSPAKYLSKRKRGDEKNDHTSHFLKGKKNKVNHHGMESKMVSGLPFENRNWQVKPARATFKPTKALPTLEQFRSSIQDKCKKSGKRNIRYEFVDIDNFIHVLQVNPSANRAKISVYSRDNQGRLQLMCFTGVDPDFETGTANYYSLLEISYRVKNVHLKIEMS
jgi:hypothetical protein